MNKNEPYKRIIVFLVGFVVWSLMVALWSYEWMSNYANTILRPFGYKGNWLVFAVYGILVAFFTHIYNGYKVGQYRISDIVFSCGFAMLVSNIITYLQTCLVARALLMPFPFLRMSVIQFGIIIIWALFANRIYRRLFPPHQMLLVYDGSESATHLISKMVNRDEKYRIIESISISAGIDTVLKKIDEHNAVILCDIKSSERNRFLKHCYDNSIRTYVTPKIADILIRGASDINIFDTPLVVIKGYGLRFEQRAAKRALDIVGSLFGIIIAFPLMLLIALFIKLQDGGPVLFKQERCTKDNKVFTIIKFRSMVINPAGEGEFQATVDGDPRITKIGKLLRPMRLDELPQLFNILKGEMSLVGPRPECLEHIEKYTAEIPEFTFRSRVKAGLTGYAQVVGRYNTSAYDKLKLDLMYISRYSFLEDIKIIIMTIKILFTKQSTEGF